MLAAALLAAAIAPGQSTGTFNPFAAGVSGRGGNPAVKTPPGPRPLTIAPSNAKVGMVGLLSQEYPHGCMLVTRVLSKSEVLVNADRVQKGAPYFAIISGVDTSELVDDEVVRFPGMFRVTGTRKLGGGTYHVFRFDKQATAEYEEAVAKWHETKAKREREAYKSARERTERDRKEREQAAKERKASAELRYAQKLLSDGDKAKGRKRLNELVERYPGTEAAEKARALLAK